MNRKQWDPVISQFLNPVSSRLIHRLALQPGHAVLDVATGTGEPGLTIASLHPQVSVTGTDIAANMLQIAADKAGSQQLNNYRTHCCEAASMPFADQSFDAAICRNGVMFFSNVSAALNEIYRVLKPGGNIAVSTWGVLDKNLWINVVLDTITEVTHHKSYNRHRPGMFYCMQPGTMTDWFETANFSDITEEEMTGVVEFTSMDDYWYYVTTVSADVVNALREVPELIRNEIRTAVMRKIDHHNLNGRIYFQWSMHITSAHR
ncbi:Ubiquinone/menaquinone biosynthesis C-methylase UbiE [Chitinophaga jiangningensis]|uniref:Ubiquinone/menaquinone biosynthesis C-methylase UbiE n=1 Tax=Chitinophaga jiangningensis TaxID=1419482 RepID=A0A1M7K029_9BACT|nr:class I SAM-dependent methyltransferase [Chitinophaga jiangningensis]SHM58578.1 Ubiquinone/menaquinone biosynthesis C-methylase UbiE [Chitinophaga jiangningensis]